MHKRAPQKQDTWCSMRCTVLKLIFNWKTSVVCIWHGMLALMEIQKKLSIDWVQAVLSHFIHSEMCGLRSAVHICTRYSRWISCLQNSGYLQVEPFCLHYSIKYSSFFSISYWKSLKHLTVISHSGEKKVLQINFGERRMRLGMLPRVYIRVHLNEHLSKVLHPAIIFF